MKHKTTGQEEQLGSGQTPMEALTRRETIRATDGLTQVCAWCGRVLGSSGHWHEPDELDDQEGSRLPSHGICTDCANRLNLGT